MRPGALLAAPYIVPATALGDDKRAAPSGRINLGVIGIGPRGTYDLRAMLKLPDVQCLAVCDAQASRRGHVLQSCLPEAALSDSAAGRGENLRPAFVGNARARAHTGGTRFRQSVS